MTIFMPKIILVTGGAGFIGTNLMRILISAIPSVELINVDKLTYAGSRTNLLALHGDKRYHFFEGDICDTELLDKVFGKFPVDTVIHLAAESHVDRSISGPSPFIRTNIDGTYRLLEALRRHWPADSLHNFRFVHVSTDEVYGSLQADEPEFSESDAYRPSSPYSASKAAADHLVKAWHTTYGTPAIITNCSNNYGPFQHEEKLIPTVIKSCMRCVPIPVYGDGSNIRDWIYVQDHCEGIIAAMRYGQVGESYNFGGGNEWSNIELVKLICRMVDRLRPENAPHEALIDFVPDRLGHDWRYAINSSKAQKALGWSTKETFESSMGKTIQWYLDNRY